MGRELFLEKEALVNEEQGFFYGLTCKSWIKSFLTWMELIIEGQI